ncbi:MAG: ParB N-terminal domain-containing protein [Bacteroidales bacterium]|nr:ParB N-terminal domain-containing protein [Bacteroidales bacterium]
MADYSWFNKRYQRSIDQLRPWSGNPRLNPEEQHVNLRDFVEDIIQEDGDKANFMDLVRSIATNGFIPADPIVVWKDAKNDRYYVAEGNRRVLALKLLRDPSKAPREIRGTVKSLSKTWTRIDKIHVNIAPSLEDAEWYISQRNSTSSILKRWSRLQQMRWVEFLYEKYADDPEVLVQKSNMSLSEIEQIIRYIRLLNLVNEEQVKSVLTEDEYRRATAHTFPITIFERFFNLTKVREAWGFDFDGPNIIFKNKAGFLTAFTEVIRRIVSNKQDYKLDTRNVSADRIDDLLDILPKVNLEMSDPFKVGNKDEPEPDPTPEPEPQPDPKPSHREQKGNIYRNRLILSFYQLNTSEARLSQLFYELKRLSVNSYVSVCAAAVRIFLELAILDFIQSEGLVEEFQRRDGKELKKILLKTRIDFLTRYSKLKDNKTAKKILLDLINEKETYSLDILNGYVHSKSTEYLNKQYLNGFWDHIFPLLQAMLDITEDPED